MGLICKAHSFTAFGQGPGPCQQMYLRPRTVSDPICTVKEKILCLGCVFLQLLGSFQGLRTWQLKVKI